MTRRRGGDETWFRLRDWTRGQKEAERLAAHILHIEGYMSVEPSHPLGGPDGLKDIVCTRENKRWIGAVSFPRGEKPFSETQKKFQHDLKGVSVNQADGIAFVTNQELTLSQRKELKNVAVEVDLLHLERIAHILDRSASYGVRLEFLDIEMTKEEQLAFTAATHEAMEHLLNSVSELVEMQKSAKSAESFRAPVHVIPNYGNAISASSILGRSKKLHKCSYCGYGFYINDMFDDPMIAVGFFSDKTVTCPKCGNTWGID